MLPGMAGGNQTIPIEKMESGKQLTIANHFSRL